MPTGVQVWDKNGNLVLDTNSRLPKFIDEIVITNPETQGMTGSKTYSIGTNKLIILASMGMLDCYAFYPTVWISNDNTVNWSFPKKGSAVSHYYPETVISVFLG